MELTAPSLILQTLPETLALVSLAMALADRKLELKFILLISLPYVISVYLIRLMDLTFGVHTIILIIILAVLLRLVLKIKLSRSLLSALITLISLAAVETASLMLALTITGIEFEQIAQDNTLWILFGWPHIIFIFLLALAIIRWRQNRRVKEGRIDV